MTICRTSGIVLGLYYKLIEAGIDARHAMMIVHMLSRTSIINRLKEGSVPFLIEDIATSYNKLIKLCKIPTEIHGEPEKDEEQLIEDSLSLLEASIIANTQVNNELS